MRPAPTSHSDVAGRPGRLGVLFRQPRGPRGQGGPGEHAAQPQGRPGRSLD
jgi:hypothetical protein